MAIDINSITNSTKITNGALDGTGVFDSLMNTLNLYLIEDYNQGRLKGTDYATVRLGGIQSVIQQSIQFAIEQEKIKLSKIPSVMR